ncbi:N-acetylglucosamine-6-phosphate deacetylase [Serinicoccus chungangensis]|uniref:N-acetylglucosamine-6-phosphate deacetylase n=1 Tax=Serinicoccus chungangensis TaxID=767452 RepID=A0A0W8I530_9MICO|nr:N-acetylglucosamine-6-phosphate deacetylase [Serinicoccus chungangensis]KUG53370.1 N-acetylglucosamine-6-phosphate deacetylase [Serinicoccus chungangensis]
MRERMVLSGEQVLWPDGTLAGGWVAVEGDRITQVGRGAPLYPADRHTPFLAPGFVDMHCHGGGGHTFATTDPEEVHAAAATHHAAGTTTVVASLVSADPQTLLEQVRALAPLVRGTMIAGIHLEGPWLSPLHRGAHRLEDLRHPDPAEIDALLEAGAGTICMVTLAPELPGGMEAVRRFVAAGVVVAVGHTDADADQLREAVDAGATVVTHLFNAMRPLHHRDPGPVVAALADPRLAVELIVDGVHVHPDVVELTVRSTLSRIVLVSDAMAGAAAADGRYRLGPMDVEVVDGVARTLDNGSIAGSTLTLDRAVRTGVAAGVARCAALLSATWGPARTLGLDAGQLAPGHRADVVGLDRDLEVRLVLRHGEVLRDDAAAGPGGDD